MRSACGLRPGSAGVPPAELRLGALALGRADISMKRTVSRAVNRDFSPVIHALTPVIPAKAGIQTAANAAGTPASEQCQCALAAPRPIP